jgi:hypothetical protein
MSSMAEALISKVIKSPLLWGHRIKGYQNRDIIDKEWRNLSQTRHLYVVTTQIYVQICWTEFMWLHSVMMTEFLHISNSFLLPPYRTSWTVEKITKQVSRFFWQKR